MKNEFLENISNLILSAKAHDYNGSSVLYCVLHRKKNNDYLNLFSVAIFDEKISNNNNIETLDYKISSDTYSVFFYRQNIEMELFEKILNSYENDSLSILSNNYPPTKLRIIKSSIKEMSLLDTEAVNEHYEGLFPKVSENFYLFEFFSLDKRPLFNINNVEVKIDRFCDILKENFNIDLKNYEDRIGNFMVIIPETRISSSFYGTYKNKDILFVENKINGNVNPEDLLITLKTESNNEIVESALIENIGEKLYLDKFNKSGKIFLEIWNKKNNKLVFSNKGILISDIIFNTSIIIGKRIVKDVLSGKTTEVELVSKDHDSKAKEPEIYDFISSRIDKKNKESLVNAKSIFFYRENQRSKAIDDIIGIINNETEDYLLLWDPYFNEHDLNSFLPYISNMGLDIKVISDYSSLNTQYVDENDFKRKVQLAVSNLKKAGLKIEFRYKYENIGFPFHDRFIITKTKCWMLGPSFNSLGKSHSVMVKLPYPEIIQEEYFKLWDDLESKCIL